MKTLSKGRCLSALYATTFTKSISVHPWLAPQNPVYLYFHKSSSMRQLRLNQFNRFPERLRIEALCYIQYLLPIKGQEADLPATKSPKHSEILNTRVGEKVFFMDTNVLV